MKTGKKFSKLEAEPPAPPPSLTLPIKTNKNKVEMCEKQPIATEHSKIKKTQVGSFEKELKQCGKCKRNFVNLQLHKTKSNCFEPDVFKSPTNLNVDKKNTFKQTEKCRGESITNSDLGTICKGCSKVFERLLRHLNSKKGSTCKEFYDANELEKPPSKVFL